MRRGKKSIMASESIIRDILAGIDQNPSDWRARTLILADAVEELAGSEPDPAMDFRAIAYALRDTTRYETSQIPRSFAFRAWGDMVLEHANAFADFTPFRHESGLTVAERRWINGFYAAYGQRVSPVHTD